MRNRVFDFEEEIMWESITVAEPSDRWTELDETGWDALIGWAAGPQNLRRFPNSDIGRVVSMTRTRDGVTEQFEEAFTADDRRTVDDSIDDYLADAGIPARPRGYRWFIRVPEAYDSAYAFHHDLHIVINATTPAQTSPRPVDWRPLIEGVVQGFYS
jgi:hypothetical protein